MITGKTIALTTRTFVSKMMPLLFNALSRFVIAFLPRSKCLLNSWLQSPSAVMLESKKIKSVTVSTFPPSTCHGVMGPDAVIIVFWVLSRSSWVETSLPLLWTRPCWRLSTSQSHCAAWLGPCLSCGDNSLSKNLLLLPGSLLLVLTASCTVRVKVEWSRWLNFGTEVRGATLGEFNSLGLLYFLVCPGEWNEILTSWKATCKTHSKLAKMLSSDCRYY